MSTGTTLRSYVLECF
jgi:hypothetical protein